MSRGRILTVFDFWVVLLICNYLFVICYSLLYKTIQFLSRFIGQNRPQFRAPTVEDPGQVKDLVDKLEKHQNPGVEDSVSFVRMELAR